MFLSLIDLQSNRENAKILGNPYKTHQIIWEAFKCNQRNFLFRVENSVKIPDSWNIYILSETMPNFNILNEKTKIIMNGFRTKEFKPKLENGMKLRFYLRANATIKKFSEKEKKGKRLAILKEEELLQWILKKAEKHGFMLKSESTKLSNKRTYKSFKGLGEKMITLGGVDFSGILTVRDCTAFNNALKKGIGSAKAFGFGLLSIMPL